MVVLNTDTITLFPDGMGMFAIVAVQTDTDLSGVHHSYLAVAEPPLDEGARVPPALAVVLVDWDNVVLFRSRILLSPRELGMLSGGEEVALVWLGTGHDRPTEMTAAMRSIGMTRPYLLNTDADGASFFRHAKMFGNEHPMVIAAHLAVGGRPTPDGQDFERVEGDAPWSVLTTEERLVRLIARPAIDTGVPS